ncbi:hypothetical protein [Pseudonocardia spinosispora]|uniref:hypothetical protein n=1 Tax=Pseudonocardia spinosispora TaxID=103441 RepID=UPI00056B0194
MPTEIPVAVAIMRSDPVRAGPDDPTCRRRSLGVDTRLPANCGGVTPRALVESALWGCGLSEEHGFADLEISVEHHDPLTCRESR